MGATAVGPDGSVVVAVSKPRLPGDLFVLDANPPAGSEQPRRLTDVNGELLSSIWLSDVEELRFPTLDGTEIQTFVYKPRSFNPDRTSTRPFSGFTAGRNPSTTMVLISAFSCLRPMATSW